MSLDPRLLAQLEAADRSLSRERLPPREVHRIARRLSKELGVVQARHRGWLPMATFVAGAVLVMVFLAWMRGPTPEAAAPGNGPAIASLSGAACRYEGEARVEARGACSIVGKSTPMRIETSADARISVEARAVTMHDGTATFDVDPVEGAPLQVSTPGGRIVVVGTRFEVTVSGGESRIDLFEGKLAVYPMDGPVATMVAGESRILSTSAVTLVGGGSKDAGAPDPTVATGASPTPEAAGTSASPDDALTPAADPTTHRRREERRAGASSRAGGPRKDVTPPPTAAAPPAAADEPEPATAQERVAALISELRALRRAGKLDAAARLLTDALQEDWPPRHAEVLSYELGTIYARHLHASARACEHWAAHLERFPSTRYADPIERSKTALSCE